MHKYFWRKVLHHDTDTFKKFDFKKSKEPRNNGSIQVWAKCCINWSFRHIFSTRVASPLYSSQNPGKRKHCWDKTTLSLHCEAKTKKQTRPKAVQLTKPWEKKTFLRQNHLIIVIRADKKIPSEMEVAPRYNCWHCWHCWHSWHCWHFSTLFDSVDMTYNE